MIACAQGSAVARYREPHYARVPMAQETEQPDQPTACGPCRGTGTISSNLGGSAHELPCPWCEGAGIQLAGHDAQARWRAQDDASASA
jgi:DnaJ-class molecular chaperone